MNSDVYAALTVAVMSLGTIVLRFLPFCLFGGKRRVPQWILYLGEVLPAAAMGMLVVYCLRDLSFRAWPYGLPQLLSCGVTVFVQYRKRNSILSILAGTGCYMLLLHLPGLVL